MRVTCESGDRIQNSMFSKDSLATRWSSFEAPVVGVRCHVSVDSTLRPPGTRGLKQAD
jgi:hypothetical protein